MRAILSRLHSFASATLVFVVAAVNCWMPHGALAQSSTMSASNTSDGLSVRAEWFSSNHPQGGYQPVTLELASTKGPRELLLVMRNRAYPIGNEASQRIELDGTNPVRLTLSIPLTTNNFFGILHIYERNVELEKLRLTGIGGAGGWWTNPPPTVLLVARTTPDWRLFETAINNHITGASGQSMQHPVVAPDKAPSRWIDYTTFDLVLTPLSELAQMPAASREALMAWVSAGGNLVVYGVLNEKDQSQFDRLLELELRSPSLTEWRLPKPEDRRVSTINAASTQNRNWHTEALSRLTNQGLEQYQAYCTEVFNRHAASLRTASDMNTLAWACVLGPDAVPEMDRVVRLAETAVAREPGSYAYLNTLGVALYRAGRHQEAIQKLNRAIVLHRRGGTAADWIFIAMANHHLGNKDETNHWLQKAVALDSEGLQFRKEAEELIKSGGQAAEKKQAESKRQPPSDAVEAKTQGATEIVAPHFAVRRFGFGQLTRMAVADPFPGVEADWTWLFRTLGEDRLRWTDRHGLTARGRNPDFWSFLIPSVGRAPVIAFQLLITVFAVVIGPLNYFALKNRKRLYLLVLTVPFLAILTSGALLGYAMASDGFDVRTRVRSVTILDQTHGEAVSWSRISYYAGLAPAGGLRFSTDTAVFPFESGETRPGYRMVDWGSNQHLVSGWLRSRTPTQLVTVNSRQTGEQLAIAAGDSGAVRVTNNLGAQVDLLVLADQDGRVYRSENLGAGARVLLEPVVSVDECFEAFRELTQAQPLETPKDLLESPAGYGLLPRSRFFWNQEATASWGSSLLEVHLRQLSTSSNQFQTMLKPRTYVAVVQRPPFVELGVEKSVDAGSLYVVWGWY